MKKKWVLILIAFGILGTGAFVKFRKPESENKIVNTKAENVVYWTCPMHPQVHEDHPGECPICHMKLVKVSATKSSSAKDQGDRRAEIQATDDQLNLAGIQKHEVEKMNLKVLIPVSGRFTSSRTLIFQIYESDLRYVKPGLPFKGESTFYPEVEIRGIISAVDSIVDPTSRTVRVVGSVQSGPTGTLSETGFRGEIELELKSRIAIPESSVLHTGQGELVYLFSEKEKLIAKPVKLGLKAQGFYDVLSGLEVGSVISSGPNFLIDSEAKIRGAQ